MQLLVNGKQVDIGPELHDHVSERLQSGVSKYFDRALNAHVHFSREGQSIRTEISVHAGAGIHLQSHALAKDKAAAFDMAADRMEKRLRRHKRRLVSVHHGRQGDQQSAPVEDPTETSEPARQIVLAGEDDGVELGDNPVTIAESTTEIRSLTVGEAVMRLELGGEAVLMFRNSGHGGLNVVYHRADGNVGWIDPPKSAGDN